MTAEKVARGKAKARPNRVGPRSLQGSVEARRHASAILEVLSGAQRPAAVCEALGISAMRYYLLETRALQGMLTALEPRPKGRVSTPAKEVETLREERRRLERDLVRTQALLRATQRAAGLLVAPSPTKGSKLSDKHGGKARRPRAVKARATRAIEALRSDAPGPSGEGSAFETAS